MEAVLGISSAVLAGFFFYLMPWKYKVAFLAMWAIVVIYWRFL